MGRSEVLNLILGGEARSESMIVGRLVRTAGVGADVSDGGGDSR